METQRYYFSTFLHGDRKLKKEYSNDEKTLLLLLLVQAWDEKLGTQELKSVSPGTSS